MVSSNIPIVTFKTNLFSNNIMYFPYYYTLVLFISNIFRFKTNSWLPTRWRLIKICIFYSHCKQYDLFEYSRRQKYETRIWLNYYGALAINYNIMYTLYTLHSRMLLLRFFDAQITIFRSIKTHFRLSMID